MLALWQTVFAGLTLLLFAVSAAIALLQLHHLRLTYQLSSSSTLLSTYWTPQFQEWLHFTYFELDERLKEPGYFDELGHLPVDRLRHNEIYVCEYYGLLGSFVKHGLMPTAIFLPNGSRDAVIAWERLYKAIEKMREADSSLYIDFEYLVALCRDWLNVASRVR